MTIIQHNSPVNASSKSLKNSYQEVNSKESFESVFEAVVVEKAPPAEVSRHRDDVNSEIQIPHSELLIAFDEVHDEAVSLEIIHCIPVNLRQEHLKEEKTKRTSALMVEGLRYKKPSKNDGTELDISMLVPLVAAEIKLSKPEASDASQALDDSIISNLRAYPEAFESAMHVDANELESFNRAASFVVSSEEFLLPPASKEINLMQKAESVRSVIDRMTKIDPMDALSDEVHIISVDISSKIPEVTLENNASMTGESAEDLNDFAALEQDIEPATEFDTAIKTVQPMMTAEISDTTDGIKELSTVSAQQIHQAIQAGKEGILPKETKTLSIVLNPEELGVVNVELTSDLAGKISAVLSVEKQETLNLLQQDLHQLKSILKEIGIDDSSVSLQLSSNADQGQQQQSEYVSWDERERMLTRNQHAANEPAAVKAVAEKSMYNGRSTTRRLDIQA
jgi:hypothetical protein